MAVTTHEVVKPQAIADAAVTAIAEKLVVASTLTRFDAGEFLGKAGDKITKRVPGSLPFRRWGWRNDRREPIRVDRYTETTVDMTVDADWIYSAIEMIPEQRVFDFGGSFGDLFNMQTDAIVQGIEFEAFGQIRNAPYERVINIEYTPEKIQAAASINQDALFNAFVDAQRDLKKMRVPDTRFVAIAGSEIIAELIKANKLIRTPGGEGAFAQATVGTYAGISFVEGPYTMASNEAYLFAPSGFLFWNAAPPIPNGAVKAATANKNGVSMQWVQDYDPAYMVDRSIFASWKSFNYTKDFLALEDGAGRLITSPQDFFLRGVKIVLNGGTGVDKKPGDGSAETPGGDPNSFLAKAFNGELAAAAELDGPLMPLWLREGAVTEAGTTPETTP